MHSLWTHYLLVAIVPWAGLGVDKDLQSPFQGFPSVSLFPAPLHGPSAILLRTATPTPSNLGMQFATPGTDGQVLYPQLRVWDQGNTGMPFVGYWSLLCY